MRLEDAAHNEGQLVLTPVRDALEGATSVADAAQIVTEAFFERYEGQVALARMFVAAPLHSLRGPWRSLAEDAAAARGVADSVDSDTLVLSLLGTCGSDAAWCDRLQSQGHAFIPLVDADTVRSAPMIAQLFLELGLPVDWVEEEPAIRVDALLNIAGTFFVEDARTALDSEGRKIIAAQDFVEANDIRSVLGVGGSWSDGTFFCFIAFTHEQLTREVAQAMVSLSEVFHRVTVNNLEAGRLFPAAA
jgi:hypothetical protein